MDAAQAARRHIGGWGRSGLGTGKDIDLGSGESTRIGAVEDPDHDDTLLGNPRRRDRSAIQTKQQAYFHQMIRRNQSQTETDYWLVASAFACFLSGS